MAAPGNVTFKCNACKNMISQPARRIIPYAEELRYQSGLRAFIIDERVKIAAEEIKTSRERERERQKERKAS